MSTLLEKLIGSAALKDNPLKCLCIKLKPGSVTTDKIADKAITPAKLSDSVKTDLIQAPINAVRENLQLSISEVQESLGDHASNTTKHITAQERNTWNSKQDALTFDNLPTQGSNNPVKSGGVYSKIQNLTTTAQLIRDDVSAIQQEMPGKQNVLTFDNTPTANSNNPVKSGGVYSKIQDLTSAIQQVSEDVGGKQDTLTFDNTPTVNSDNPVKSGGVYNAIEAAKNAIQVTTEELRSLKDNGNLIPGMNYKITDYNPTVTGTVRIADRTVNISNQLYLKNNTQVAPFDIVLTALSTTDISEKGLAVGKYYTNRETIQRYYGYWRNTNFTAWELNVIVDTDDDRRPTWCREDDAPVWISYMKDEWGNEAPFDFKTYGISLPDGATINETYNSEELDNNNVWLKGNRWHIFTHYDNGGFAYDNSLEGYVKNVKITDWNIIIGGIVNSSITGASNIIVNTNDIQDERFENIIVEGDLHRMWGSAPDHGNDNVIKGYSNIVVSSVVTTEWHNSHCIIKDSESVYLGNYNNNIVIRNCSDINIGNSNSDWDINYAGNVYIGNNNVKDDNDTNTNPNYIHPGTYDGEIWNVGNIKIGNNNKNIRLYAPNRFNIGDYNRSITVKCTEDGFQAYDYTIGNNNNISIIYADIHDIKIGDHNNIRINADTASAAYTIQGIFIGHNNTFKIIGNESGISNITINNWNETNNPLDLTSASNNKRFYFDGVWTSKSIND